MSEQDLDKLFRSKLEELKRKPSDDAWNKIQAASEKRAWPWMRIAAAIILLFTAGALVFLLQPEVSDSTIVSQKTTIDSASQSDIQTENQRAVPNTDSKTEVQEEPQPVKDQAPVKRLPQNASERNIAKADSKPEAEALETKDMETLIAVADVKEPVIDEEVIAQVTPEEKTLIDGNTMSFSIDDFNAAEKTTLMASAESNEDESGLKKVWGFLKQVKEPEAGFGELRDLKNNILAFGKDKNETE